ncbi:hypothetical protein F8M41_022891 [Gigaspora margarita]|uniref:Uncharacterized protein n=1 Tax=Gigaspora margarita TaxID=4874 RepID=A0A8H4EHQ8_GIGMA|nr:hypothetical protein F8M41_022891 [Gigaspora margarita]
MELEKKYKDLNMKYRALKKDHDTGDDYYTESQHFLKRENAILNEELSKEIDKLKNKRETLSEVVYIIN